ncbi:MAG: hypothetical protein HYZ11_16360 [Candidatus Tectomicrobia bacterium]|uniref:Uncharacterized protein n=1 Tax=Tectimicrobiota bacterium TaxID=2528274 RepID=A0A932I0P9_UNCTE|nr:hypothetical protein [Candidatus Tectomicrobia bacterium]
MRILESRMLPWVLCGILTLIIFMLWLSRGANASDALSIVSLGISILAFVGAIYFFAKGIELQSNATDALAEIRERSASIQRQVDSMFGGTLTLDAARGFRELLQAPATPKEQEKALEASPKKATGESVATQENADTIAKILKYFTFKGMRLSDKDDANVQALLKMGGGYFHIFDGAGKICFFAWFVDLALEEMAFRVKYVFNGVETAYYNLENNPEHPQREFVSRLLSYISMTVLLPEGYDTNSLESRITPMQSAKHPIPVALIKASDLSKVA